ncbi:MAG TPA: hypothetical protein VMS22_19120 [Candidatus Eisenbacteria bacterium]|nr:hypothetical protein [Candidatus Eisenbacteria bacterium]
MSVRDTIRRASEGPARDLWPRLRARLDEADGRVEIRLPGITWVEMSAMAAAAAMLVFVPEPARFLAACGLL